MRHYLIILLALFFYKPAQAQCPEVSFNSIRNICDSQNLTPDKKMEKLFAFLRKIKTRGCINDSVYAMLLRQIGFVYNDESDYIRGIPYFQESIRVINNNIGKPAINPRHLIDSYFWLSTFYDSLNNSKEKLIAIDSCIAVSKRLGEGSNISCLRCLVTRAEYYFDIGDYYRCAKDAEMCERLARQYAAINAVQANDFALISLGWLVEAYVKLKEFKKAEEFLTSEIDDFKKSGLKYLGFAYGQMAQLEIYKGYNAKAILLFNKALAIEAKGGFDFTCKQILNTIGHDIYFRKKNDNAGALHFYTKALGYHNKEHSKIKDDIVETLEILTRMGDVYVRQGSYDVALRYFQQAFDLIRPNMTEAALLHMPLEEIINLKKTHVLVALVIDKGDAYLAKYKQNKNNDDVARAIRIYKIADKLLVMLRATQQDLRSKLFWRSDSRRLYERAIEACYLSENASEAFYFFEKSRAVLLNEQLTQQSFLTIEEISNQLQLSKKMLLLERDLNSAVADSKKYIDIQNQLFTYQQRMDRLVQQIKTKNPLYYQAVLDTSAISLKDIYSTILRDHQAIVEIFSGDSAVYSLLITRHKIFLNKIGKDSFENTANRYIRFIANPSLLNKNFQGFKVVAHQLYRSIFKNTEVPKGRIIISPDGKNFPFESLVVNYNLSLPDYFINDHAVSYTYSARYLLNTFNANKSSCTGDFMGVAPVNFSPHLASLPGSDQSLKSIAINFENTRNLIAVNASKSSFISQMANYSIIQVYTHATASGDTKEPVIYFADSTLYLSDLIPGVKPATRLIVLSACETGEGKFYLGEGVFNFNRGFAAYGIPSSITNLWSVESRATYKLTELFYKYLGRNMPIDLALQSAKKEFIEKSSQKEKLPYYWAAAILMGKTEALGVKEQPSRALSLILSGILLLFMIAAFYFKGNKLSFSN